MFSININNKIEIIRDDNGDIPTPFEVYLKAKQIKRTHKYKIFIDNRYVTTSQLEAWSYEESRNLPKCKGCGTFLKGIVFNHPLCEKNLFCTQHCADKDYIYEYERWNTDESDCS